MLDPSRAEEALGADVLVGLATDGRPEAANEAAVALQAALRSAFPARPTLAVVLSARPEGTAEPGTPLLPAGDGRPAPALHAAGSGPEAALHALLDVALELRAPVCALLEPMPRPADPRWRLGLRGERLDAGNPDYGSNAAVLASSSYAPGRSSLMA